MLRWYGTVSVLHRPEKLVSRTLLSGLSRRGINGLILDPSLPSSPFFLSLSLSLSLLCLFLLSIFSPFLLCQSLYILPLLSSTPPFPFLNLLLFPFLFRLHFSYYVFSFFFWFSLSLPLSFPLPLPDNCDQLHIASNPTKVTGLSPVMEHSLGFRLTG